MQLLSSLAGLAILGTVIFSLHTWSNAPDVEQAERTVLTTGLWTVAGGTIVNFACALVTWGVGAVPLGEELGACSPYGLAGGAVSARFVVRILALTRGDETDES